MIAACVNQVTKLVRSNELTAHDRELIFEAIGFKFLIRLLRTGTYFLCVIYILDFIFRLS